MWIFLLSFIQQTTVERTKKKRRSFLHRFFSFSALYNVYKYTSFTLNLSVRTLLLMRWKLLIAISCNVNELEKHIISAECPGYRCTLYMYRMGIGWMYQMFYWSLLVCCTRFWKNLKKISIKFSTRLSTVSRLVNRFEKPSKHLLSHPNCTVVIHIF